MGFLALSTLFFALNNLFWKLRLLKASALEVVWGRSLFTSLIATAALLVTEGRGAVEVLWRMLAEDALLCLASVVCGGFGLLGLVKGLRRSRLVQFSLFHAMITGLSGLGMAWLVGLGARTLIGVGLIGLAFAVHVRTSSESHPDDHKASREAIGWLALMTVGFTLNAFIVWSFVQRHPVTVLIAAQEWAVFAVSSVLMLRISADRRTGQPCLRHLGFAAVIFLAIYFGDLGLRITDPFMQSAWGLIVPVMTAAMGVLFLREPVPRSLVFSAGLVLAGLLVLLL